MCSTNTKCSRIKASCERGAVIISYDCSYGDERAHSKAAEALVDKFKGEDCAKYGTESNKNPWGRRFVSGGLPQGGYAHVFID